MFSVSDVLIVVLMLVLTQISFTSVLITERPITGSCTSNRQSQIVDTQTGILYKKNILYFQNIFVCPT